jgi:hypothetical protein
MTVEQMIIALEQLKDNENATPKLPFQIHEPIRDLMKSRGYITDAIAILDAIDGQEDL